MTIKEIVNRKKIERANASNAFMEKANADNANPCTVKYRASNQYRYKELCTSERIVEKCAGVLKCDNRNNQNLYK